MIGGSSIKQLRQLMEKLTPKIPSSWNALPTPESPDSNKLLIGFIKTELTDPCGIVFFMQDNENTNDIVLKVPYLALKEETQLSSSFRNVIVSIQQTLTEYARFKLPEEVSEIPDIVFKATIHLTFIKSEDQKFESVLASLGFSLINTGSTRVWQQTIFKKTSILTTFQKLNDQRSFGTAESCRGRLLTNS